MPWLTLAVGLLLYTLAELTEAAYAIGAGIDDPFPSVADLFFFLSYPLFIEAFLIFLRVYRESGFPVGAGLRPFVWIGTLLFVIVGAATLVPILDAPGPSLDTFLTAGYIVGNVVLLVPLLRLLDATFAFRGGTVWTVWAGILLGFALIWVGDILFAYFQLRGQETLDLPADVLYTFGEGAILFGVWRQDRLLRT
jgi:hypothetical protein